MSELDIRLRAYCRTYRAGRCPLVAYVFVT
jgi:hypothetical protein